MTPALRWFVPPPVGSIHVFPTGGLPKTARRARPDHPDIAFRSLRLAPVSTPSFWFGGCFLKDRLEETGLQENTPISECPERKTVPNWHRLHHLSTWDGKLLGIPQG